jgi:hypothetical protein
MREVEMNKKISLIIALSFLVLLNIAPVYAETITEVELDIPGQQFGSILFNVTKNYSGFFLSINASYDVDVLVMNELSYQIYLTGFGPGRILDEEDVVVGEFNFQVNQQGLHFIVVENRYFFNVQVDVVLTARTVGQTIGLILGPVAGFVGVIGSFITYNYVKNKKIG